ncbi:unnamed protein product [Effrenium voratum]|nr:unnamed protein product [Effrenium voratum]
MWVCQAFWLNHNMRSVVSHAARQKERSPSQNILPKGPNPEKAQKLYLRGWRPLGFKSSWSRICSCGWLHIKVDRKSLVGMGHAQASSRSVRCQKEHDVALT